MMNYLYDINSKLRAGKNYIYGDGKHATHIGKYFEKRGIPFEGFCSLHKRHEELLGKKVIEIEEFNKLEEANLLLTQNKWQNVYDELYKQVEASRIYVNTTWTKEDEACIICDNPFTFAGGARFVPFLKERMFNNEDRDTQIIHCPRCRMFYSSYRPSDDEMDLLYTGYRDETYQKIREKYEPSYTKEFNKKLFAPADGGEKRRQNIAHFLIPVIKTKELKNILDFGGDKEQFIPKNWEKANKYVYEISEREVIYGVVLLTDKHDLGLYQWDLILCNMVLEHLSDVKSYFKELVKYMGDNTLLYVEVPNDASEDTELVRIHEHINFFKEETFYYLAEMNNLEVIRSSTTQDIRVVFKKKGNV